MSYDKTSIDEAVLERWATKLPGCRRFLENFFLSCGAYSPKVNYSNYVRDLNIYAATNRHIRDNLSSLITAFHDVTRDRSEEVSARVDRNRTSIDSLAASQAIADPAHFWGDNNSSNYHGMVLIFKKKLLERTLEQYGGNRTHAARALGLQRTYLLRLVREFGIRVPTAKRGPNHG